MISVAVADYAHRQAAAAAGPSVRADNDPGRWGPGLFAGVADWPHIDEMFAAKSLSILAAGGFSSWLGMGGRPGYDGRLSFGAVSSPALQIVQELADTFGGFLWTDDAGASWAVDALLSAEELGSVLGPACGTAGLSPTANELAVMLRATTGLEIAELELGRLGWDPRAAAQDLRNPDPPREVAPMKTPPQPSKASQPARTIEEALAPYQPHARAIEEISGAVVLATCIGNSYGEEFGPRAFNAYHDNMLEAAGQPTDPIEAMLIEQLLWAHHRLGHLHLQATSAQAPEAAALYNAAAARLMGEFRKMTLALREYRTPAVSKHLTVVKQQNVAAGDQQIAYLEGKAAPPLGPTTDRDIDMSSNRQEAITHEAQTAFIAQPQAGGCRETELVEARPVDAGRPGKTATVGTCPPAVGAHHRSKNGRG